MLCESTEVEEAEKQTRNGSVARHCGLTQSGRPGSALVLGQELTLCLEPIAQRISFASFRLALLGNEVGAKRNYLRGKLCAGGNAGSVHWGRHC